MKSRILSVISLIGINFIYAFTGFFTKSASACEFLSINYIMYMAGAVGVLALYALLWQQILKSTPVSDAYMFKGTAIIFTLIISALIFEESITLSNIIGATIIICGIALFAKT